MINLCGFVAFSYLNVAKKVKKIEITCLWVSIMILLR